jgi:signal transduction histidine kinase
MQRANSRARLESVGKDIVNERTAGVGEAAQEQRLALSARVRGAPPGSASLPVKLLRGLAFAFAALVLVGGWFYFYFSARAADLRAHTRGMVALRTLAQIDHRWDGLLEAMRAGEAPPTIDFAAGRSEAAQLLAAGIGAESSAAVQSLSALRQSFDDKAALGPALATAAQVRYDAARELAAAIATGRTRAAEMPPAARATLEARLAALESAASRFAARPDQQTERALRAAADQAYPQVATLGAAAPDVRGSTATLVGATRVAEKLADGFVLLPTGPRLDTLSRALERDYDNALADAELNRVYLLFYSGFLLTVLAYYVMKLAESFRVIRSKNAELEHANETLETRVAERTRELSDTLGLLKQSEAMLIQSEKMSSLGQMVAGIAHEVNTPLAYVKSSLDAVNTRLPEIEAMTGETSSLVEALGTESPDEQELAQRYAKVSERLAAMREHDALTELRSLVQDGRHGIDRISELVTGLRDFSRLDRSKLAEFDLNEGIESTLVIARNMLKGREVHKELGRIPRISCAPSQLNQVFLNMINNAAQATPEQGGVVFVRTRTVGQDQVAIDVIDNGHGIPKDVMPKIFDPFFTTKDVGKGTGLGLSISYKIVESHGGRIEVASEVGKGTRFTILLPVRAPAEVASIAATA